jgi:GNAT superfamily N-acetyltransferase
MSANGLRLASRVDAAAVAEVLRQSFTEYAASYTRAGFAATAISSEDVCRRMGEGPVWVALWDDSIVGTAAAVESGSDLCLRGMAVVPRARGAHVGRSLLAEVEQFGRIRGLRRLILRTTPFLTTAIRLYEANGFRRAEESPQDLFGTPLFTMTKSLSAT